LAQRDGLGKLSERVRHKLSFLVITLGKRRVAVERGEEGEGEDMGDVHDDDNEEVEEEEEESEESEEAQFGTWRSAYN